MGSHQSPLWSSAASVGSQFFCFLATTDHFSSTWISRVGGGQSHELGVSVGGVLTGGTGQADDGVSMDTDEPAGGTEAAALVEVFAHGVGLLLGQMAAVEGRPLALGEAGAAAVAG